ncbi:MAG: GNAT family N-acetyltransferase [Clostridia bacterium]
MFSLQSLELSTLSSLYMERIAKDFPANERPPLPALRTLLAEGVCQAWVLMQQEQPAAYAITATEGADVLVTHLAVFQERRGGGIGSALLAQLAAQFAAKRALIIEVEDPAYATSAPEKVLRIRRIAFYQRAGFQRLPAVRYTLFGVALHLMALPLQGPIEAVSENIVAIMQACYLPLLPPDLYPQMQVARVE